MNKFQLNPLLADMNLEGVCDLANKLLKESQFGIFLNDSIDFDEWGYLPIVDCTLLWMGELIPFEKNSLELVNELNETG